MSEEDAKTKGAQNLEKEPSEAEGQDGTLRLKTRPLPALLMLLGAAVAALIAWRDDYSLNDFLKVVLCAMVIFLVFGHILKLMLDAVVIKKKRISGDGSVIEKNVDAPGASDGGTEDAAGGGG